MLAAFVVLIGFWAIVFVVVGVGLVYKYILLRRRRKIRPWFDDFI